MERRGQERMEERKNGRPRKKVEKIIKKKRCKRRVNK